MGDFGDVEGDFLLDLGDLERDSERESCRLFKGVVERFPFDADLEGVLERSFAAAAAAVV